MTQHIVSRAGSRLPFPQKQNIKISVIMPIYNAYDYLRPAIESVLDQTLTEIELICVDDGSVDNTAKVVETSIIMPLNARIESFKTNELSSMNG